MKNDTPIAYPSSVAIVTEYRLSCHGILCQLSRYTVTVVTHQQGASFVGFVGTVDFVGNVGLVGNVGKAQPPRPTPNLSHRREEAGVDLGGCAQGRGG